jgi:hypothetical protein
MPEKTLMWGNPTRERDLIIMLQENTKQQQNHISNEGKYVTTPNLSHINLPRFFVPKPY